MINFIMEIVNYTDSPLVASSMTQHVSPQIATKRHQRAVIIDNLVCFDVNTTARNRYCWFHFWLVFLIHFNTQAPSLVVGQH